MEIASHLSWANFLQCKLHFSQPNIFFSLQASSVQGSVSILMDGNVMSVAYDGSTSNGATITGTAIITMEPGQRVSDCLPFFVLHETNNNILSN